MAGDWLSFEKKPLPQQVKHKWCYWSDIGECPTQGKTIEKGTEVIMVFYDQGCARVFCCEACLAEWLKNRGLGIGDPSLITIERKDDTA